MMQKNKLIIILLTIVTVLSGFGREYVMKNINWIFKYLSQGGSNYAQSEFNFLLSWNLSEINILKWGLTLFFTGYFFYLTFIIIKLIFPNFRKYRILIIGFYFIITAVSGLLYLVGWLTGTLNNVYNVTRTLMGVAQSFMPLMIFYLLFKFFPKLKEQN